MISSGNALLATAADSFTNVEPFILSFLLQMSLDLPWFHNVDYAF